MDVFNLIYEALQIIYAIIPKELFIIILGIITVFRILESRNEWREILKDETDSES